MVMCPLCDAAMPPGRLAGDAGDGEAGLLLAVARLAAIALALLELEDHDLVTAMVTGDRRGDGRAVNDRGADLRGAVAADHEDAIESDLASLIAREALDGDRVTLGDAVLLATGLDDRVLRRGLYCIAHR